MAAAEAEAWRRRMRGGKVSEKEDELVKRRMRRLEMRGGERRTEICEGASPALEAEAQALLLATEAALTAEAEATE